MYVFDRSLFVFFLIWYVVGLFLLSFDLLPPWLDWSIVVFIITSGIMAFLFFIRSRSWEYGWLSISIIFFLSMAAESIGVRTGIIFGDYTYMTDFGPKIADVPITIGFAWVMVMGTSHVLAAPVTKRVKRFTWLIYSAYGALVATALDLIIDPVAYGVKQYWVWNEGGFYYGIPFTNFLGWFVPSFVLHVFIFLLFYGKNGWHNTRSPFWEQRMLILYVMMSLMFIIVALVNGLLFASLLSAFLVTIFCCGYFFFRGHPA